MHRSNWFLFCSTDGERAVPNWQPVMLSQFHDGRHDMGPDGFIKDDNMPKDARFLGETRPAKLAKFPWDPAQVDEASRQNGTLLIVNSAEQR